ncbi:MAG: tyrosine-protein kinase [Gaiellaceae bacterium]|nr:tyrosine-protein kinase [Gaiellaceae bacterium]
MVRTLSYRQYPVVSSREDVGEERGGAAAYGQALREHWLLIVAIVVVAVGAAAAYSLTAAKQYTATADVLVTPIASQDDTYVGLPSLLRETNQGRAVLTAARLLTSPDLADRVDSRLRLGWSRDRILSSVSVSPVGQSNIVTVTAKADTPDRAALIANGFANELINTRTGLFQAQLKTAIRELRQELRPIPAAQQQLGQGLAIASRLGSLTPLVGQADPTLQVSSHAVPPEKASWPRPVLSIVVAFLASLLLAVGLAIGLELVSPRVTSEDEVRLRQRLPILARVPRMSKKTVRAYLRGDEPLPGDVREAYRTLRAALTTRGTLPETILVTSASPGEGKTMTSVNLALTIASAGMRVVLVDADLRRPMVGTVFNLPLSPIGFASVLAEETTVEEALVAAPGSRDLRLLLASPEHAHFVDLLQPERIERVLAELRLHADVVVIDSAPIAAVADALNLAAEVAAVVVAVRLGRTRRDKLSELRRMLSRQGVTPTGAVVTTKRRSRGDGYYYSASAEPQASVGARRARSAEVPAGAVAGPGDDEL